MATPKSDNLTRKYYSPQTTDHRQLKLTLSYFKTLLEMPGNATKPNVQQMDTTSSTVDDADSNIDSSDDDISFKYSPCLSLEQILIDQARSTPQTTETKQKRKGPINAGVDDINRKSGMKRVSWGVDDHHESENCVKKKRAREELRNKDDDMKKNCLSDAAPIQNTNDWKQQQNATLSHTVNTVNELAERNDDVGIDNGANNNPAKQKHLSAAASAQNTDDGEQHNVTSHTTANLTNQNINKSDESDDNNDDNVEDGGKLDKAPTQEIIEIQNRNISLQEIANMMSDVKETNRLLMIDLKQSMTREIRKVERQVRRSERHMRKYMRNAKRREREMRRFMRREARETKKENVEMEKKKPCFTLLKNGTMRAWV